MSEQTESAQQSKHTIEALELDIDLTKADLDFPLFHDQLVKVRIVGAEIKPNKEETGRNLVITGVNENPIKSTNGREFAPGKMPFKKYHSLQPSTKNPDWDWTAPIAKLQLAALGERKTKLTLPDFAGKQVYFQLKLDAKAKRTNVDDVLAVSEVEK